MWIPICCYPGNKLLVFILLCMLNFFLFLIHIKPHRNVCECTIGNHCTSIFKSIYIMKKNWFVVHVKKKYKIAFSFVCLSKRQIFESSKWGLYVHSPEREEKTRCEMATRERRRRIFYFLYLWSNLSLASLQIDTSINIHERGEESVALLCKGRKEGGALFSTWSPIFSCNIASLGLFPNHGEAKYSCIEA